jgi:cellulose synthase (UDP-forming)
MAMNGNLDRNIENLIEQPIWEHRWALWAVLLLCVLPIYVVITVPLSLSWQFAFGVAMFLAANWLNRIEGRLVSLMMMGISVLVSTRYLYWRVTESVAFSEHSILDNGFAIGLILAELYAYIVLVLGYFQVLWPLQRKPSPLMTPPTEWPTVDIYIPTYNEPLKVVRPTVLAALAMDWPKDRFNVYVLDDGRRQEFKDFCASVGATHITRNDSKHAKAGNLNRAMEKTNGQYIAIFDCDHVPTRSFLQITVGWFLRDAKLGMLQTPHHFFSPDPFERNLGTFRKVPNEGELFYGLLQDGNDFWNATFFCGSCAVLRRTALMEVGGIAVETVTEDAHTSLKMHRRGWHTAYINLAQAAGLATESLSAHVGQRIRWARGMAQIFRTDNPLLGKGLKWGQRICYTNAMLHFFYGLPRLVFLTAPLSYLFFQAHIIQAGALLILAYAAPHIMHANLTNSRLQGPFRHSFWAEVYETVLATYILVPTLLALVNPKLGTFNVTAKGGLVSHEYFDRDIAKPYVTILILNMLGLAVGVMRLVFWNTHELDTVVLNLLWTTYNIIIVGAALSVAWESRQIRAAIRVSTDISARVRVPGGPEIIATTIDLSEGGTALTLSQPMHLPLDSHVQVALAPEFKLVWIDATVTRSTGGILAMQFSEMNLRQESQLIYAIFGRADAWVHWAENRPMDDMRQSFKQVLTLGVVGTLRMATVGFATAGSEMKQSLKKIVRMFKPRKAVTAGLLIGLACGSAGFSPRSNAQSAPDSYNTQSIAAQPAGLVPSSAPQPMLAQPTAVNSATRTETRSLSFKDLGVQKPIRLRGSQGEYAIPLSVRDDEVITKARLKIKFAHSPALLYNISHINVLVNSELVGTIRINEDTAGGAERTIDVDPRLFVQYNQIGLQAIMSYTMDCQNPVDSSLWTIVSNTSTLDVEVQPLALPNDLKTLPQPFFDSRDSRKLTLPFVFTSAPGLPELEAAGVIASWFGSIATYRAASFPVYINQLPPGHAVVISSNGQLPDGLQLPGGSGGAKVSMLDNPRGRGAKLLVVSGSDGASLNMAARALTLSTQALGGDNVAVRELTEPKERKAYDAPRWIPTDRPVPVGELVEPYALEATGLYPEPIRVPFHAPPDLFTWRGSGMKLKLKYRYTPTVGSKSTLNVNSNGEFVSAVALSSTGEDQASADRINLPFVGQVDSTNSATVYVPDYKFGADNALQFQYYFERKKEGPCKDVVLDNLRGSIDEDSTIDLSAYPHYTHLPELALFANGGFPFSKYADLSQTAIVVPDGIGAKDAEAYLTVMGRIGNATGYPAYRFKLGHAADVGSFSDRDILVLGSGPSQPLLDQWAEQMPMTFSGGVTRLRVIGPVERLRARWEGRDIDAAMDHAGNVILQAGHTLAAMMSFESPLSSGHTVVVLTAGDGDRLADLASILSDSGKTQFLRGDLVLLNGDEINHYVMGSQYAVGHLPFFTALRWWFAQQPVILAFVALFAALLVAVVMFRTLRRMAVVRKGGGGGH